MSTKEYNLNVAESFLHAIKKYHRLCEEYYSLCKDDCPYPKGCPGIKLVEKKMRALIKREAKLWPFAEKGYNFFIPRTGVNYRTNDMRDKHISAEAERVLKTVKKDAVEVDRDYLLSLSYSEDLQKRQTLIESKAREFVDRLKVGKEAKSGQGEGKAAPWWKKVGRYFVKNHKWLIAAIIVPIVAPIIVLLVTKKLGN